MQWFNDLGKFKELAVVLLVIGAGTAIFTLHFFSAIALIFAGRYLIEVS